jgi:hypothetical protein
LVQKYSHGVQAAIGLADQSLYEPFGAEDLQTFWSTRLAFLEENRVAGKALHPPGKNMTRFQGFYIDYVTFRETLDENLAKQRATELLPQAPLVYAGAPLKGG